MYRNYKILAISLLLLLGGILSCSQPEYQKSVSGELRLIDLVHIPVPDPEIDSIISIYRTKLSAEMDQIIGYAATTISRGSPEGLLNNFVADLVLETARLLYDEEAESVIDFCVLNYGGLRNNIPEGPISRSRIFEVMPFENEMVVLTLSPENTWKVFEYIASRSSGVPIAGLRIVVNDGKVVSVSIQGEEFDPGRNYRVLTSDYLAGGGDQMQFFANPINYEIVGMRIRDAMLLHISEAHERGEVIDPKLDGRISSN